MPCCETCTCIGQEFECLSVVDPVRFGYFHDYCLGTDEHQRRVVLGRSRIGVDPATVPVAAQPAGPPAADLPFAGDVLEAAIKRFGGDRLARYIEAKTGRPCNCESRRLALNALDAKLRKYMGMG